MAEKDAGIILQIEDEAQPGGLLSQERSSIYVPEPAEEPPRQWAHIDHLTKQMANFRKLMLMEQQRHKSTAKRLAEACRDEWIRRQPKSAEQIEAEARAMWTGRYRTVVKVLAGTWENVKTEINRRRLEEWEAAEQRRVKAALNEAVNMSEMKLQARRTHADSELLSDEDESDEDMNDSDQDISPDEEDGLSSDHDSDSDVGPQRDEDNMSSSDDDDDDAKSTVSDEGLTQDQLRQKYANVPDLPPSEDPVNGIQSEDPGETTDESVDMDDDLGSSDDEMASQEDDDGEESEEEGGEDQSGLLDLLFGKSELKKLKEEVTENDEPTATDDVEMEDAGPTKNETTATVGDGQLAGNIDADETRAPPTQALSNINTEKPPIQHSNPQSFVHDADVSSKKSTDSISHTRPPTNPLDADKPDAPPAAPGPLQLQDVEMEIINAVEHAKDAAAPETSASATGPDPSAVLSVEVTSTQMDQLQTSPDTDAVTSPPSRDRSQSPRTSDTKPSDVDTAPTTIKSLTSRSSSPQSQVPKTDVPFLLRGSLREYQHYGLDWLAGLYKNKTNGILADEMGLGKTIQTIALLAHLACQHEVWGPHLVIVPTSVMLNWEMEFKKWCPGFKVLSYYGSIEERKRKRQGWKTDDMWNVCITSYQIVLQDQQVFKRRQWHYMILDEAHNIKNFKSKRWQTLLTFNTQARLLLTGTPLQNNLTELWSLLFFLMPSENGVGGFADLAEFQDWFHKPESQILESGREQMDEEARAIIAKLHKVLRPAARWGRFEELQHCVYLNALRRQQRPIYGKRLTDFLTLGINQRPHKPKPRVPRQVMSWFEEDSPVLRSMVLTLDQRATSMKSTISKFACITPAVVTRDMDRFVLGSKGVTAFSDTDLTLSAPVRYAPFMPKEPPLDPWHESRMRLSIQFPDRRLLQYDCGKLQALDRLLRKLQSGGHRALIFTQMTKVLDILEQFLNIHGHKYLRLDGATKVEQRQILTDRFNHDTRILCFILSTRSGGLGINLTGADTVVFYDQDWNPAMDKQCQDRCHRIGQTRDVHIYRLVSEHTIEANILRKAGQKQMLDDVVIQEGGFTTDYFTKKAMRDAAASATGTSADDDVVGDAMDRVLGGGVVESTGGRVLEQAEDREDIAAARVAEREIQEDEADFAEKPVIPNLNSSGASSATTPAATRDASAAPSGGAGGGGTGIGRSNLGLYAETAATADGLLEVGGAAEGGGQVVEYNAYGNRMRNIDEFMLATMKALLEGTPLELPRDHRKKKGGGKGNKKGGKDTRKR
ncbi:putative helicase swr-1 protein [Eutypa lata UCREL1]|uniref:DNA helicase n=1 Tax=Eutypa lata (strain UCR-EL1) TaxID=1287681 RepID=M7SNY8_EUTLA|nr:putative helicase swr-1 protein [Eutypa lata UCREL1]